MPTTSSPLPRFLTRPPSAFGKPVCRLGLASHGQTAITPEDVLSAVGRGVNFLNWPGLAEGPGGKDAFSEAVGQLGRLREGVVVCVQFGARTADDAREELDAVLSSLKTGYVDVLTLYYVERIEEWRQISQPGGAVEYLTQAKRAGIVRRIGITSHQRPLAATMASSGTLDCVMIRYNAAHRGAERDVFPVTDARGTPVIAYTATRWGALMRPTPDDPPGFAVPGAAEWYRFVLHSPSVAVVLAAPHSREELEQDLAVLSMTGPLPEGEYRRLAGHGERVRRHAGAFR